MKQVPAATAVAVVLGLVGTALVLLATPAAACLCPPIPPMAERISRAAQAADAEPGRVLFIGEQVTDTAPWAVFRVDRVLGGEWANSTIEAMPPEEASTSCGSSGPFYGMGIGVFEAIPGEEGVVVPGPGCGGSPFAVDDALAVLVEPPRPMGTGPPAFVVGHRSAVSHLALLDDNAEVVAYSTDRSRARVLELEVCPGAETVVAAVWSPGGGSQAERVRLEVRSLPDLALQSTHETGLSAIHGSSWQARTITDIECHTEDGNSLSYLAPQWSDGPPILEGATLVVARDGGVSHHDVGPVRAITFDPETDTALAVDGEAGRALITFDLDTESRSETRLPGDAAGRSIQRNRDGGIVILAEADPSDGVHEHLWRVDTVVSGPLDGLRVLPLGLTGSLRAVARNGSGVAATLWIPGEAIWSLSVRPDGSTQPIRLRGQGDTEAHALGAGGLILGGQSRPSWLDFVADDGERSTIVGIESASVATSLSPFEEHWFDELPELPPSPDGNHETAAGPTAADDQPSEGPTWLYALMVLGIVGIVAGVVIGRRQQLDEDDEDDGPDGAD